MQSPRVTLRDIANRAGVHLSTVSLALRNHPRIPAETRKRIHAIAEELGYEPDPMLSALALYRDRRRPKAFHGTLAWLANSDGGFDWSKSSHYSKYYSGVETRAREYGYNVEVFDFAASPEMSPQRMSAIFRARNITGLFLCPHPTGFAGVDFPWEDFSLITFGYSMTKLRLHTVASAHYRNARRVLQEVAERGYRRPGLVISGQTDMICDYNISAAYLLEQSLAKVRRSIPPLIDLKEHPGKLKPWLEKYQVDVIVTTQEYTNLLLEAGLPIPEKLGLANLSLPRKNQLVSGIMEDDEKIGAVAADLLVAAIHRGERGVPSDPQRTHLEGFWNEGKTLRSRLP